MKQIITKFEAEVHLKFSNLCGIKTKTYCHLIYFRDGNALKIMCFPRLFWRNNRAASTVKEKQIAWKMHTPGLTSNPPKQPPAHDVGKENKSKYVAFCVTSCEAGAILMKDLKPQKLPGDVADEDWEHSKL